MRRRVAAAIRTRPDRRAWGIALREAAWLLPVIVLCGMAGGFLTWAPVTDLRAWAAFAAIALFAPALGEELLFRAAILPRADEVRSALLATVVSVAAFVAWHPLQALLYGPENVPAFSDPWFLLAVAALGLALARVYRATESLWVCVALHWLVVVGWKALLGGPPVPFA